MPYTQAGLPWAPQSETSYEAAARATDFVGLQGEEVYAHVITCGDYGATQKETAAWYCPDFPDRHRPSMAARFNALEKCGRLLKVPGLRREGCAVYVVA